MLGGQEVEAKEACGHLICDPRCLFQYQGSGPQRRMTTMTNDCTRPARSTTLPERADRVSSGHTQIGARRFHTPHTALVLLLASLWFTPVVALPQDAHLCELRSSQSLAGSGAPLRLCGGRGRSLTREAPPVIRSSSWNWLTEDSSRKSSKVGGQPVSTCKVSRIPRP